MRRWWGNTAATRLPLALAVAVTIAVAAGCAVEEVVGEGEANAASGLVPFTDCAELVSYFDSNAERGYAGRVVEEAVAAPSEPAAEAPAPAEPAPAAEAAAPGDAFGDAGAARPSAGLPDSGELLPGTDFSVTNVQEAGVDEPDLVKTDGARLFALARGAVFALDVRTSSPRLLGRLDVSAIQDPRLLLSGDRLLVLGFDPAYVGFSTRAGDDYLYGSYPLARLLEVDVSDPAQMTVVRALSVEGAFVNARLTGQTARVVITSPPKVEPIAGGQGWLEDWEAEASGVGLAADAWDRWVPHYELEDARTGEVRRGVVAECGEVSRPTEFSGLGLVSVLTIDLRRGLDPVDRDAVVGDAQTVYASPGSLYVATLPWADGDVGFGTSTVVHRFDIAEPDRTFFRASGRVRGYLLSQWSLSEHLGTLRVATTGEPPWWDDGGSGSESFVTALAERDGELREIGSVGNLGRGERIFGVRFLGDVGYVVTFRQIDPLYTIDLSNPEHPKVRGELKIPGYSSYLHPIDTGLLLGIGQDATETGATLGTQIALFDVTDLEHPRRLDKRTLGGGSSEAEADHHAFLWWPKARLGVLPVQGPSDTAGGWFSGAVGFGAGRSEGIVPRGTIAHPTGAQIRRALVVGNSLLTVSDDGVEASDVATLDERGWAAFA